MTYNCSINADLQLMWNITSPAFEQISIIPDGDNEVFIPEMNISSILTRSTCGEYTESQLTITLPVNTSGLILLCGTRNGAYQQTLDLGTAVSQKGTSYIGL